MQKRLFRLLSLITITCVLSTGLSGCTTKKDTSSAQKKVKVRIMTRWTGADTNTVALEKLLKQFTDKNPNIQVVNESISDSTAYGNKLKTQTATGDIPNIFQVDGQQHDYAKNGVIADLSSNFSEDKAWSNGFVPGIIDVLGKFPDLKGLYVVPMQADFEPFYYNTELFAKAGIAKAPVTFDELLNAITKLKAAGITPIGAGAKDMWRIMHIHNGIWMKIIGPQKSMDLSTGKLKFTDPEVVNTFKVVKQLFDSGAFDKDMLGIDYASEQASFLAGKTAMMYNGTWFVGNISSSEIKDKVKTFLMPSMTNYPQNKDNDILYSGGFVVSNLIKDPDEKIATIKLIKYLSGTEANNTFVSVTKKPPFRTDLTVKIDDPLLASIIQLEKGKTGGTDVSTYTLKAKMMDIIGNNLVAILSGSKTPEQAAKVIQDEMDKD